MKISKKSKNDIILISVILVAALIFLAVFTLNKQEGSAVTVKIDGVDSDIYELNKDISVDIVTGENDEFINTLVIADGKAYIVNANCPDKICEGHRPVSYTGETIVCLPHKVTIEITAAKTDIELDAVA